MFQRVISQICWISLVVTLVLQLMNCVWADDAVKKHQIEFKNDIWPILTNHCLRCHGPERSEGGLRLDRKKFVLKGGHTGNPVLGTLQNSELLRRVTSTNDAYRMPKDATPLSNVEKELLQKWIEQGSNWPTQRSTAGTASNVNLNRGFSVDDLASLFERFGVATEPMRPLLGPFFFFLVLVMYAERIRQKPATTPSVEDSRSNRFQNWLMTNFRIPQYMIGILIFSNLGMWLFHRSTNPFSKEQSTTKTATNDEQEDLEYQFVAKAPKIYTPKRNRQFGGAYYRGNDERNNKLFNGGYYRTCTFYLALRDQSERQLQPGMNIDGAEIFIELVIERAPFATRELFRDEAITSSVLTSRFVDSGPPGQFPDEANFQTEQSGERWSAKYSLGQLEQTGHHRRSGTLYVATNKIVHYAIEYDIDVEEDVISSKSILTMGTVYLTKQVVIIPPDGLSLQEWFDSEPIPVIEGGNTDDPQLLGIPEHRKSSTQTNAPEQGSNGPENKAE